MLPLDFLQILVAACSMHIGCVALLALHLLLHFRKPGRQTDATIHVHALIDVLLDRWIHVHALIDVLLDRW